MKKNSNFVILVICMLLCLIGASFLYVFQFALAANFVLVVISILLIELIILSLGEDFNYINNKLEKIAIKYRDLLIKLRLDNETIIILSIVSFVFLISFTPLPAILQGSLVIFFSMAIFVFDGVYRNLEKK